jgi:hypothetical protein
MIPHLIFAVDEKKFFGRRTVWSSSLLHGSLLNEVEKW